MLAARGGVHRTHEQYVLDGLDQLATWASHLFLCVLWEESLRVCSYKSMSGDDTVQRVKRENLAAFGLTRSVGRDLSLGGLVRAVSYAWEVRGVECHRSVHAAIAIAFVFSLVPEVSCANGLECQLSRSLEADRGAKRPLSRGSDR